MLVARECLRGKKLGNSVDTFRSKPLINPAMKRLLIGSPLVFLFASALLAQDASPTPEISGAAAAGILGGVCIFYLILIAIWLFVAIWIMKDSKKRNSPNRTLVVVLGWLVWPVGLIVHLVTRPKTIPGGPTP